MARPARNENAILENQRIGGVYEDFDDMLIDIEYSSKNNNALVITEMKLDKEQGFLDCHFEERLPFQTQLIDIKSARYRVIFSVLEDDTHIIRDILKIRMGAKFPF